MDFVPVCDSKFEQIRAYYIALLEAWGRQHWWPARSRFEVISGAYLTQNTSWNNVEKALQSLRRAGVLSVDGIRRTPTAKLEKLIRSAGYFRQKAQRLKAFVKFLDERYAGSLTRMFAQPTAQLREELLSLNGIGPETADSILLYAGNHAVFVVDAYTRRILERHGIISPQASYEEIRELCERALLTVAADDVNEASHLANQNLISYQKTISVTEGTGDSLQDRTSRKGTKHRPSRISEARRTALAQVFNEMHGLIVGVGKNHCQKSQMRCEECPLQKFLPGKP